MKDIVVEAEVNNEQEKPLQVPGSEGSIARFELHQILVQRFPVLVNVRGRMFCGCSAREGLLDRVIGFSMIPLVTRADGG